MNGNRMKYASTPTYGMQKRGFQKKAAEKQPQAPDFTQAPDLGAPNALPPVSFPQPQVAAGSPVLFSQAGGMLPQAGAMPPQSMAGLPMQPGTPMQQSPSGIPFQQSPIVPMSNPFMLGGAYPYGNAQVPFSAPMNGMPGYSLGQTSMPPAGISAMPPMASAAQPPLQQQKQAAQSDAPFSPRAQGYIPPQPSVATNRTIPASSFLGGQQSPAGTAATPQQAPQSFAPLPFVNPAVTGAPYWGMNNTTPGQGVPNGIAPNGGLSGQSPVGYPTDMIYPGYASAAPQPPKKPFDKAFLIKLSLFALLPFLLLMGLLIPALDAMRYAFVALSVISITLLWIWQVFQQSTRSAITIVYIALCCVALFAGGGRDAQQVSAAGRATATPEPTTAAIVLDSTLAPETTVEAPQDEALGTSEAELRLSTFMDFWQTSRVEDMVGFVLPSWATLQDSPAKELFNLLGNRTPIEYTLEAISGTNLDTSRTVTMSATIDKNNGKDPVTYRFMILMIKEDGNWYVDPKSLATNDVVTTDPNSTPTVGNMTAAPRTTITPTPAPETPLYYNPDGGTYYHSDPYCPSVKSEFLPLPGSFPYSELDAHSNLQPCLMCGAPTE